MSSTSHRLWTVTSTSSVQFLLWPVTACSHRWHRRDKTVLSCPCRWCEHNCRKDKTVSNFQVFSGPQYIWDWTVANWKMGQGKTKLSCLVTNCVHTVDADKTRQDSVVSSVLVLWTNYKSHWRKWQEYLEKSHNLQPSSVVQCSNYPDWSQSMPGPLTCSIIHNGQAPQYLSDCVSTVSAASHRYRLRSSGSAVYTLPRTKTRFGERCFFYYSPAVWNTLPSDLHDITDTSTFRKRPKSVLFDRAYHWLLLPLLDVSYSGALQIPCWLIDWSQSMPGPLTCFDGPSVLAIVTLDSAEPLE